MYKFNDRSDQELMTSQQEMLEWFLLVQGGTALGPWQPQQAVRRWRRLVSKGMRGRLSAYVMLPNGRTVYLQPSCLGLNLMGLEFDATTSTVSLSGMDERGMEARWVSLPVANVQVYLFLDHIRA